MTNKTTGPVIKCKKSNNYSWTPLKHGCELYFLEATRNPCIQQLAAKRSAQPRMACDQYKWIYAFRSREAARKFKASFDMDISILLQLRNVKTSELLDLLQVDKARLLIDFNPEDCSYMINCIKGEGLSRGGEYARQ